MNQQKKFAYLNSLIIFHKIDEKYLNPRVTIDLLNSYIKINEMIGFYYGDLLQMKYVI